MVIMPRSVCSVYVCVLCVLSLQMRSLRWIRLKKPTYLVHQENKTINGRLTSEIKTTQKKNVKKKMTPSSKTTKRMKTTQKMRTTPEMKTALKNEDHPKNEDDPKMKMTLKRKMKNFCGISYHILPRYLSICVIFIIYLLYTQQYTSPPPTLHFLFFIYIFFMHCHKPSPTLHFIH